MDPIFPVRGGYVWCNAHVDDVRVVEIIEQIFDPARPVNGKGIFNATADSPSRERVATCSQTEAGADKAWADSEAHPGPRAAAGNIEELTVGCVAKATAYRREPFDVALG